MIVALDPGGSTGVATWQGGDSEPVCFEFGGQHHRLLFNWLHKTEPRALIVEDFKWTNIPATLISVEYIGVCELYAQHRNGMHYERQSPSQKQLWDDDKIKSLGLWLPGKPHAMDALRHLLYYVTVKLKDHSFITRLRRPV